MTDTNFKAILKNLFEKGVDEATIGRAAVYLLQPDTDESRAFFEQLYMSINHN